MPCESCSVKMKCAVCGHQICRPTAMPRTRRIEGHYKHILSGSEEVAAVCVGCHEKPGILAELRRSTESTDK